MAKRLVGFDPNYNPQSFIKAKAPGAFNPYAGMPETARLSKIWGGGNPYTPAIGNAPTKARTVLDAFNRASGKTIADANTETGSKYLTDLPVAAPGSGNQLGSPQMSRIMLRAPLGTGEMVGVPVGKFARDGKIPTPDEAAKALENAQLVEHGLDPVKGLLGVASFAAPFLLPGLVAGPLGTAGKIFGLGKTIADVAGGNPKALADAGVSAGMGLVS